MPPEIVGIDLGTTFSLAAYIDKGKPVVVRDDNGVALVPSVLSFHEDGSVLVGSEARQRSSSDPDQTVYSVKRLMGRTLEELREDLPRIPYQIVEREVDEGRKVLHVKIGEREYTPEELSAKILQEIRRRAGNPKKAVITVPAYFDDSQRQATRDAGRIAGLDVLRIVNEPTAAALAYGLDRNRRGTIAVYDLGGGTFDCSILSLADGVFKVLSTHGDTRLGGDDFDRAILETVVTDLGINLDKRDPELLHYLREEAERVKIALSSADSAEFEIDLPERDLSGSRTVNRSELHELVSPLVERTLASCKSALRDAEKGVTDIDEVVLVGGSTRMPFVREQVEAFFGKKPHTDLNPDEVVAMGAAIQADILTGGRRHMLLLDVVPLSLGIETLGGAVSKIIHRNSTIPAQEEERFTTSVDNQTGVEVNIYQGERELVQDCRNLGKFTLSGIPPMPARMPQVDVMFRIDANGMLTVSATEKRSGQAAKVTVQPSHGLTQDEVEKMVLDSIEYAQDDYNARRFIELKNKATGDIRHTETALATEGVEISPDERTRIESALAKVRQAMAVEAVDELQKSLDELNESTTSLAEQMMNSVVKKTLEKQRMDEVDPNKL